MAKTVYVAIDDALPSDFMRELGSKPRRLHTITCVHDYADTMTLFGMQFLLPGA